MKRILSTLLIGGLLGLSGCDNTFIIKPKLVGNIVIVEFFDDSIWRDRPIEVCLSQLTVYSRRPPRQVWMIRARAGCVPLSGVALGNVPRGFQDASSEFQPRPGIAYTVDAMEGSGRLGFSENWTVETLN